MKKTVKILGFVLLFFIIFFITSKTSAQTGYTPLEPLPGIEQVDFSANGGGFNTYLNNMFNLGILVAAVLAVIMIIWGGFKYITSELVNSKEDARETIRSAVVGLFLALLTILILQTINESLTKFSLSIRKPEIGFASNRIGAQDNSEITPQNSVAAVRTGSSKQRDYSGILGNSFNSSLFIGEDGNQVETPPSDDNVTPDPMTTEQTAAYERAKKAAENSARMAQLKKKEGDGTLTPEERTEMEELQKEIDKNPVTPGQGDGSDGILNAKILRRGESSNGISYHDGTFTVNGHTYMYRSGGSGNGSIPTGRELEVVEHMPFRTGSAYSVPDPTERSGRFGFSFMVREPGTEDSVGDRSLFRIHPGGVNLRYTQGCLGVAGDATVQRQLRDDLTAAIRANGGSLRIRFD